MGLLGGAGAHDAALALRRRPALDARDDRPRRGRLALRAQRLHPGADGCREHALPPLRHAASDRAQVARGRDVAGVPSDRRDAPDGAGARGARAARVAVRAFHDDRAARRSGHAACRALGGRGTGCGGDRRAHRFARGVGGVRVRPRRRPDRCRLADRGPGPRGELRRRRALHRAVARLLERRRPPAGGGRLSADRGLRRRRREPRPGAAAARTGGRGARGARGVRLPAGDGRGRRRDDGASRACRTSPDGSAAGGRRGRRPRGPARGR